MSAGTQAASPRTTEQPMAFTAWEFVRGALLAWLAFNAFGPIILGITIGIGSAVSMGNVAGLGFIATGILYAPIVLIPWSLGALVLVGGPLAILLGLAMRRQARHGVHLALFATLGLLLGAGTTIAYVWVMWYQWLPGTGGVGHIWPPRGFGEALSEYIPSIVSLAACTAVAVALGWWCTARRAFRNEVRGGASGATRFGEAQPRGEAHLQVEAQS